ncbi:hypothetical protein JTE90_000660 [Oedothorax gibbosus]|uniref:m7GpppX diphosphatase n=1 Tax=Oedothorax gibbosus TaxID=931172 RepID=A0AAV6VVI7_9ARAC|nr:hypothetical protein JTE90_000660 [Oedothorax gibbosus]
MAVDLTTGSYDESGIFSKYNDISKSSNDFPIPENLFSLKNFKILEILKECSSSKTVVVEGVFPGDDRLAIVVVEKMPFDTRDLSQLFTAESRLELKFRNSIYANYHVYLPSGFNGIGVQVIFPASENDYSKFIDVPVQMVTETPELYETIVKPYMIKESSQMEDLTSIASSDTRIIYNGLRGDGFLLLKDDIERCLCTSTHFRAKAVVSQKEILSLRDLTSDHVSLLSKLRDKCMEELCKKYKVSASMVESYICYPPTAYPFQVVFETVEKDSSLKAEKAYHLETVIANLRLFPEYYQKVTLTYSLPEQDPLLQKFIEKRLSGNQH